MFRRAAVTLTFTSSDTLAVAARGHSGENSCHSSPNTFSESVALPLRPCCSVTAGLLLLYCCAALVRLLCTSERCVWNGERGQLEAYLCWLRSGTRGGVNGCHRAKANKLEVGTADASHPLHVLNETRADEAAVFI